MELYSLIFIFGLLFGSFLNVLILRVPINQDIIKLSSHCPNCKENLKWYHNIPLISYIFLKAKCSYCKEKISIQYFFVELLSAVVTLLLYMKFGFTFEFLFTMLLFYVLITLSFIDLKYKEVPDYMLLIALIFCFASQYKTPLDALIGALLFAGAFSLLEFIVTFYIQNIKSKIYKDDSLKQMNSLGEGDIPIVAIIGAILGVQSGLIAIFLSAVIAILPALYLNFMKKDVMTPFIPFLMIGFFIEYFLEISKVLK